MAEVFLHHANLLVGSPGEILPQLYTWLTDTHGLNLLQNPNVFRLETETLGIDDSRALKERQESTGFGDGRKIFIISALSITHEAQNAFLKIAEEPTGSTHFFIILPNEELLLPTLRSRLFPLTLFSKEITATSHSLYARTFISGGPRKRLEIVEEMTGAKKNVPKEEIVKFLRDLEISLYGKYQEVSLEKRREWDRFFHPIWRARQLFYRAGIGNKMVLEELALSLPRFS